MMTRAIQLGLIFILSLGLVACNGDDPAAEADTNGAETAETEEVGEVDRELTIEPRGNQMEFEQTEFTVRPGETVRLIFDNTATSPSMVHNVVILNTDDEAAVEQVGMEGQSAGMDAEYIPEDDSAVLAHSPVAQPGETVEFVFTAPEEPGNYTYLCTYPGHWATMQGTMIVEG